MGTCASDVCMHACVPREWLLAAWLPLCPSFPVYVNAMY